MILLNANERSYLPVFIGIAVIIFFVVWSILEDETKRILRAIGVLIIIISIFGYFTKGCKDDSPYPHYKSKVANDALNRKYQ